MKSIFRNPFYRGLGRLWWIPALSIACAWAAWGTAGRDTAFAVVTVLLSFAGGALLMAWGQGIAVGLRERRRHLEAGHDFLCPKCLHTGGFQFACGGCEAPVEEYLVYTEGAYVNDCPRCQAVLIPRDGEEGAGVRTYCKSCGGTADPFLYHERQVRVIGALTARDFRAFQETTQDRNWRNTPVSGWIDDGVRLTYLLNLTALPESDRELPASHAVRRMDVVWAAGEDSDPLELGRAADRLLRLIGPRGKPPALCLEAPGLPAAARNVVEGRFGAIEYGIDPAGLLQLKPPAGLPDARVVAVLGEAGFQALVEATDAAGRRLLDGPDLSRNGDGRTTRVVRLDTLMAEPGDAPLELRGVEALFIAGEELEPLSLGQSLDRFIRLGALSTDERERLVVCIECGEPADAARNALEGRFGTVLHSVTPREFLCRGAGSEGMLAEGKRSPRTRTLGVLTDEDHHRVWEVLDRSTRQRIGNGWIYGELDGNRCYVKNLSDREGLQSTFGLTPAVQEIEALWLSGEGVEPLELGRLLDRIVREARLDEQRRDAMVVVVGEDLDPAARNVLEARFSRVVYRVPVGDLLRNGRMLPALRG